MGKKGAPRTARAPARLELLTTGVPGLDEVLGGGLPALSFNLIAGGPGAGKTTLAMQLMFANATSARPGLFLTLLGETALKMLRYQQQFEFFDMARVGKDVHFLNLSEEALAGDLDLVLERIIAEVDRLRPGVVVVDSFRSLVRTHPTGGPANGLEQFVQRLALHLTTWEITSFLIGEYENQDLGNPVVTVADGILWLSQVTDRNSVVRKLQVMKVRGQASGGQGTGPRADARPPYDPHQRSRDPGLSAHSRAQVARRGGWAADLDRHRRAGRDDGGRDHLRVIPRPHRPDGIGQDHVRAAVRRGRIAGR